jgi:hypothetical protein
MVHLAFMTNTYSVSVGKHKGQNSLGYLGTCGSITAKYMLRQIKWDCTDWMHLAKGTEKWQALMDIVINFHGFHNMWRMSRLPEGPLAAQ